MKFFQEIVNYIETEYNKTSNKLGWRFLVTSKKTLDKNNGIYLITLNPGGSKEERTHSTASCENGCAYLTERWKNYKSTVSPLQNQFKFLFQEIATKINAQDYATVMESSVCGYFIPFRSANYKELRDKKESINTARNIWSKILSKGKFKIIICIDNQTYNYIKQILTEDNYTLSTEQNLNTGWGNFRAAVSKLKKNNDIFTLARFPHLSRFSIFGRKESKMHVDKIMDEIFKDYCYF